MDPNPSHGYCYRRDNKQSGEGSSRLGRSSHLPYSGRKKKNVEVEEWLQAWDLLLVLNTVGTNSPTPRSLKAATYGTST